MYTPGPWHYRSQASLDSVFHSVRAFDSEGREQGVVDLGQTFPDPDNTYKPPKFGEPYHAHHERVTANAHLIAAAPELLEALEAAEQYLEEHIDFVEEVPEEGLAVYAVVVAAIQKAKGEAV